MKKLLVLALVLCTPAAAYSMSAQSKTVDTANSKAIDAIEEDDINALQVCMQEKDFDINHQYAQLDKRTLVGELCLRARTSKSLEALKAVLHHISCKKLAHGISRDTDREGNTALHLTAYNNSPEPLRILLSHRQTLGLDFNVAAQGGKTVLHLVAMRWLPEHVKLLTRTPQLDPNIPESIYKKTALHFAAETFGEGSLALSSVGIIRDLVEAGAHVEARTENQNTAFEHHCDYISFDNEVAILDPLLFEFIAVGAQVKDTVFKRIVQKLEKEKKWFSCVTELPAGQRRAFLVSCFIAAVEGRTNVRFAGDVRIDQEFQTKILNAQDQLFGMTGIMWASARGNLPLVQKLVDETANLLLTDKAGDTALHHAVRNGHAVVAQYLQRTAPMALIIKNNNDRTPVDVAISSKKSADMLMALAK